MGEVDQNQVENDSEEFDSQEEEEFPSDETAKESSQAKSKRMLNMGAILKHKSLH